VTYERSRPNIRKGNFKVKPPRVFKMSIKKEEKKAKRETGW